MPRMQGIERDHCEFAIKSVIKAYNNFLHVAIWELLAKFKRPHGGYGKQDTIGLDSRPEIIYRRAIDRYDRDAIFVTEETDRDTRIKLPETSNPKMQPTAYLSDPTDRSSYLQKFLRKLIGESVSGNEPDEELRLDQIFSPIKAQVDIHKNLTINELINQINATELWEEFAEDPIIITGPTSAITCIMYGKAIFSIIVNYFTGDMFLACAKGLYRLNLREYDGNIRDIGFKEVVGGQPIQFRTIRSIQTPDETILRNNFKRFVTFLGKSGYRKNFNDSKIFDIDTESEFLHHVEPGGPSRILYLSELQPETAPIGFIMANGEKISEWVHWLPFIKYARDSENEPVLKLYEIGIDHPWTKEGILMSTYPAYSLFKEEGEGKSYIDINKLKNYKTPSHFRSMLVVAPYDNEWISVGMEAYDYRELEYCL